METEMGQAEMTNMYIFIYIYMLIHGKFSPKTLHFSIPELDDSGSATNLKQ